MAYNEFCIRGCKDGNTTNAQALCNHIYDVLGKRHSSPFTAPRELSCLLGCDWNMPGNYTPGVFENCKGDSGEVRASAFF